MDHNHTDHSADKPSLWYTYFGTTGASTIAFLYILFAATCIYFFLTQGHNIWGHSNVHLGH